MIVDAQVHIWGANTPERPWPPRYEPHRPVPLGKDELLADMQAAGVDRAVIVPPSWEGDRNDLGLAAALAHPDRFVVMGRLDTEAPDALEQIANWTKQPGMKGMRFTFSKPLNWGPLIEGKLDWMWVAIEKAGFPVMIITPHVQLHLIDKLAGQYPGIRFILDHMALTSALRDEQAFGTLSYLLPLAKRANIAVKASSLPAYVTEPYPYPSILPHLKQVYDSFGPRRLFWGSDLTRLPCTYRQCITHFTETVPFFTTEDREWIMGRGICEWLDWPL